MEQNNQDPYPLALLADYILMPTGSGNGVMAVCRRHKNEVKALIVNSLTGPPSLASLAFMAGEHEAEHHGGPPMPTNVRPPSSDNPTIGEALCSIDIHDPERACCATAPDTA